MTRYAIYYAPEPGPFADAAARWLGWDPASGTVVAQPVHRFDLHGATSDPRRYGFHGTIKPPFRLAEGHDVAGLQTGLADLARTLSGVTMPGLQFVNLEGFLALVPIGDPADLRDLAAIVVEGLDRFRAPPSTAEIARRRPHLLTPRQKALLVAFGYPYVMEEFRFHLTLSVALTEAEHAVLRPLAEAHFAGTVPQPFRMKALCLFGEAEDGRFHLLHRYQLH